MYCQSGRIAGLAGNHRPWEQKIIDEEMIRGFNIQGDQR